MLTFFDPVRQFGFGSVLVRLALQGREELSSLMEKLGSIPGVGSVKGEEKHDAV